MALVPLTLKQPDPDDKWSLAPADASKAVDFTDKIDLLTYIPTKNVPLYDIR